MAVTVHLLYTCICFYQCWKSSIKDDCVCVCFCQAETRAEFAERSVAKLEKTIDDLEGKTSRREARSLNP